MRKCTYALAVFLSVILFHGQQASAQIVGTNVFLQGRYLEIGMSGIGAFGTTTSPVTYHSHTGGTTATPGGTLAEVYDIGHDGWTTGSPIFMGDYTYAGYPLEGWELQVNAGRAQAFCPNTTFTTAGVGSTLTGSVTGYSNSGGTALATWTGTEAAGQLAINMTTRVDTNASWVIMTVKLYNTGITSLPGVYFLRTCDPDDDLTWAGGGVNTVNAINYQNDAQSRVLVSATGTLPNTYFGLGCSDSRAKAFVYTAWPLASSIDLATVYDETAVAIGGNYAVGYTASADKAIGLLFNLGTIAAGDSVMFSYNYAFQDTTGVDSANTTICGGPLVAGTANPNITTACVTDLVSFTLSGASAYSMTGYQWQSSPDNATWSNIAGATTSGYSFSGLAADTWYRCVVSCTASGASLPTPGVLITFAPVCSCPALSAGSVVPNITTACSSDMITLNDAGYTATGATYQWQSSPDNSIWTDVTGATTVPYSFSGLVADTYYRLVVTCTASGVTATSASQMITYTAVCACSGMTAGTVYSSVSTACATTLINLNDVGYTNTGVTMQWQASLDSAAWTDIPSGTVPYSFSGMIATTWYRLKITCLVSGTSVVSPGRKVTYVPCSGGGGGGTTNVACIGTNANVSLYPNPVKNELTIHIEPNTYTSYTITNGIGQQMIKADITGAWTIVNVKDLPAGIYYVTLRGENGNRVEKLLKW